MNLAKKTVDVYRGPGEDGWSTTTRHERHETIAPLAFPDVLVCIADFLRA